MQNNKINEHTGLLTDSYITEICNLLNNSTAKIKFDPDYSSIENTEQFLRANILKYIGEDWRYAYDKYNPYLFCSTYGRFYSAHKHEICSQKANKRGHIEFSYKTKRLNCNGVTTHKNPHILLYKVFNGNIPVGYDIHHNDYNNTGHNNNHIDNLVCVSKEEHIKIHVNDVSTFRYIITTAKQNDNNSVKTNNKTNNIMNSSSLNDFQYNLLRMALMNDDTEFFNKLTNVFSNTTVITPVSNGTKSKAYIEGANLAIKCFNKNISKSSTTTYKTLSSSKNGYSYRNSANTAKGIAAIDKFNGFCDKYDELYKFAV